MPDFKRQHFVPLAHLRKFTFDDKKNNTYLLQNHNWVKVSVKRQCQKDYFFSKQRPQESESQLKMGEDLLRIFEAQATDHMHSAPSVYFLIDLHFRSARYATDVESLDERLVQYDQVFSGFLQKGVLAAFDYKIQSKEFREMHYALQCSWKVARYLAQGGSFITSDCPVSIISARKKVAMLLYAVSPNELLVLYNFRIIGTPKPKLAGPSFVNAANFQLALSCNNNIYSKEMRGDRETAALINAREQAQNAPGSYWVTSAGKKTVNPHMINFDDSEGNPLFTYAIEENPFPIIPYLEAKERLRLGEIVFNPVSKKVSVRKQMSPSDFFCLYQLALIPQIPTDGLA